MAESSKPRFEIKLKGPFLLLAAVLFILPWLLLIWIATRPPLFKFERDVLVPIRRFTHPEQKTYKNGRWGRLEVIPMTVQPPGRMFSPNFKWDESRTWTFDGATLEQVRALFQTAALPSDIVDELIKATKPLATGKGVATSAPDEVLWRFTPEMRARLYPLIGAYKGNINYALPYSFKSESVDDWFYKCNLPKPIIEKLRSMIYMHNDMFCVSDIHLLEPFLKTPVEKMRCIRILMRSKVLSVYLTVDEGEDIADLVSYWGVLGREEVIETALEPLQTVRGGGKIDLVHLLPLIPRLRLNTYVTVEETRSGFNIDCHWASLNFFNKEVDPRLYFAKNPQNLFPLITEPLDGADPRFGDVILFLDGKQNVVHSCVYIADDIVFTKNGTQMNSVFSFDTLENLKDLYAFYGGNTIRTLRRTQPNTLQIKSN